MGTTRAVIAAAAATGVAGAVTAATGAGVVSLSSLASSPQSIGEGRPWLLLTSGLVADRPIAPSLVGFWLVCAAALATCSAGVVVRVAVVGHTLSAVAVYAVIALARLSDPGAFASVVALPDFGLSAMIAAWLGAIARVLWRRFPSRRAHVLVALGSVGCAGIGLACRPDVTFLDSEHLVAFAIGVALVDLGFARGLLRPPRRLPVRYRTARETATSG
jgi:hypothetical protein